MNRCRRFNGWWCGISRKVKGKNEKVFNFEGLCIEFNEHYNATIYLKFMWIYFGEDEFVYNELLNCMLYIHTQWAPLSTFWFLWKHFDWPIKNIKEHWKMFPHLDFPTIGENIRNKRNPYRISNFNSEHFFSKNFLENSEQYRNWNSNKFSWRVKFKWRINCEKFTSQFIISI